MVLAITCHRSNRDRMTPFRRLREDLRRPVGPRSASVPADPAEHAANFGRPDARSPIPAFAGPIDPA
jgi:hypothetical protein